MLNCISIISKFNISKKDGQKISIITTVAITAILALCYNIFVCYILDKIKIPITLLSLTIINLAISAGFIIKIAKDKQIQQYTIGKEISSSP